MNRWAKVTSVATAVAAVVAAGGVVAPVGAGASPSCAVRWGSVEKRATSSGRSGSQSLTNVRAGRHTCYDRLVLDVAGSGWVRVRYVRAVPYQAKDGYIPLRGGAFLEILTGPAYDVRTGAATYAPRNPRELVDVRGWRTLRQAAYGGSFEGETSLGLGVRARLPFRIVGVSGPGAGSRLVIDVAHRW